MKTTLVLLTIAQTLLLSASAGSYTVDLSRNVRQNPNKRTYGQKSDENDANSAFVIDLVNEHEIIYLGPVYIGSNMDFSSSIVYDSGSGALTATGPQCSSCDTTFYDPSASTTATFVKTGTLDYGSAHLEGSYYTDSVSVDGGVNVLQNYELFSIEYQEGLTGFDGILGLSPQSLFVTGLKDQGVIDQAILGFYIDVEGITSTVTFGDYDDSEFESPEVFFPLLHPLLTNPWWQVAISVASYSGTNFLQNGGSAIFDSGTSLMAIPHADLVALSDLLAVDNPDFNCAAGTCYHFGPCSSIVDQLSNLEFQFGTNDVFHLTPDEYLLKGEDLGVDIPICYLGIAGQFGMTMYIMGDSFLRSHYQIYDYDNELVGIARTKGNHSPIFMK